MSLYKTQMPRTALPHSARGLLVSGEPFHPSEKARYWQQADLRMVAEVTGSLDVAVKLGDRVAAGHLPNKYLLCLKVVTADTRTFVGYQCPCGTHLTTSAE